jgi:hypothetical protein
MKQSALLEFSSSAFAVDPGEDAETNPGIFGRALANWVADQLRRRGIGAGEVIPEDFGWCIPIESKPHSLYVACASTESGPHHWRIFAFAEGGFMSRLFGKDTSAASVESLFGVLKHLLQSAPDVQGLHEVTP